MASVGGERKIDHAIKELKLAIGTLPEDTVFNIVFYGDNVRAWKPAPVSASEENKAAARKWAEAVRPDGNTNLFEAVESAFGKAGRGSMARIRAMAADTFYLLTDGRANRGKIIDPGEILEEIARLNRYHKVTIHAISLGNDADPGFTRELAVRFGGRFMHLKGKERLPR